MVTVTGAFNKLSFELIIGGVTENDYGSYRCQIKNSEGMSYQTVELKSKDILCIEFIFFRIRNSYLLCGVWRGIKILDFG